ncbi:MAG: UDP-N-acetylmuramate:L-alanyl-gamma-D-glutamyl-meso-diaminopimelate ligase [Deltaproteobacteria bacterium]|nr:UDP-N-acetylmuramate:L-alanyl-gamma-D-glutamyl-meso-diaminopimelate ligase [Deltaproteobacteria bacterium]
MNENRTIPENVKKIYLMAICGTGMGSLAGLLKEQGYNVAGSDANVYPPMSTELERQNIAIYSPFQESNLQDFEPDLVIVGNAISKTNPEAAYLLETDIPYISMPEALNHFFLKDKDVIVVSGTHGKTTTTTIMAHLLTELKQDPSFLIGGVAKNFGKNFQIGKGKYFVIEGDEYDTAFFDKGPKFLHYNPKHVILTSLEFDHADIYDSLDQIKKSFSLLLEIIPPQGSLHIGSDDQAARDVLSAQQQAQKIHSETFVLKYGCQEGADWQLSDFSANAEGSVFSLKGSQQKIHSPLTGEYNALNVLACFSVLTQLGFSWDDIQAALQNFKGVKRRQEIIYQNDHTVLIDDFAHHPTAVQKTIVAIKEKFPEHHLLAVFEPRSNTSRTDRFQNEYQKAFEVAGELILAPVNNPTKVKNGNVLNTKKIADHLCDAGIKALAATSSDEIFNNILQKLESSQQKVAVLVMSNGGFDGLVSKLKQHLESH